MLTPARAAISRVDAPVKPRAANTSSAADRMRALVDPGASRAFSSADLLTTDECLERSTTRRQASRESLGVPQRAQPLAGGVVDHPLLASARVGLGLGLRPGDRLAERGARGLVEPV